MPNSPTPSARARAVVHPGPPGPLRIEHVPARHARSLRLSLAPGQTLQQALLDALVPLGVRTAAASLHGGTLDELDFCIPIPDPRGEVVCTYGDPHSARGVRLLASSVSFALGENDHPYIHCHASFCGADGRVQGGHLLPERTRIGAEPVVARVTTLDGVDLRLVFDEETRLHMLRPRLESAHA